MTDAPSDLQAITITAREKAELLPAESSADLGPDEIRGRTLASLVSPGTELSWNYLGQGGDFPSQPGYAAVFEAEEVGKDVEDIRPGDRLFCMGGHRSRQQQSANNVVPLPKELAAKEAVLARLMGVSMTTLMTTAARPGDIVLVTGLGPVGYLCAHLFKAGGYDVHTADPDEGRQALVKQSGLSNVYAGASGNEAIQGRVGLAVDCSGHEQAVLDSARAVRKGGEVVLVGVPWKRYTDLTAHDLLDAVFHNYVVLRSGWEWEIPRHTSDFNPHSNYSGFELGLKWLAQGRIPTEGLIKTHTPQNCQAVYQSLLNRSAEGLFQVFDWQKV